MFKINSNLHTEFASIYCFSLKTLKAATRKLQYPASLLLIIKSEDRKTEAKTARARQCPKSFNNYEIASSNLAPTTPQLYPLIEGYFLYRFLTCRNEEGVGAAILESGIPREELFVVTKVSACDWVWGVCVTECEVVVWVYVTECEVCVCDGMWLSVRWWCDGMWLSVRYVCVTECYLCLQAWNNEHGREEINEAFQRSLKKWVEFISKLQIIQKKKLIMRC